MFSKISDGYENMESARIPTKDSSFGWSRIACKSLKEFSRRSETGGRQLEHWLLQIACHGVRRDTQLKDDEE